MTIPWWAWAALAAFVASMMSLDLWVFHRRAQQPSLRRSALLTLLWVGLGLSFAGLLQWWLGGEAAGSYLAGYLVEYSLSVDNLFVFAMIFTAFAVPAALQHRALMVGIAGALVFRTIFIVAGTAVLARFHWMIYVLGAVLVLTGLRMARPGPREVHPEQNPVLRLIRRVVPITPSIRSDRLLVSEHGRVLGTPLLAAIAALTAADLAFALDSVPAIFSITLEPFIVFSANAFALLGLRTVYFLLARTIALFIYLQTGVAVLLVLVGIKMLVSDFVHVPIAVSLMIIAVTLLGAVLASLWASRRAPRLAVGEPSPASATDASTCRAAASK